MKKWFTLIELLATIVVLAVISMITIGVVTNNIEATKQKTFEINASNLLDATKEVYSEFKMEETDYFKPNSIDKNDETLTITYKFYNYQPQKDNQTEKDYIKEIESYDYKCELEK